MHEHAGAQTKPHTSVSTFLLAAEQMIDNASTEVYAREGKSDFQNSLRLLSRKVYETRLKEIGS